MLLTRMETYFLGIIKQMQSSINARSNTSQYLTKKHYNITNIHKFLHIFWIIFWKI